MKEQAQKLTAEQKAQLRKEAVMRVLNGEPAIQVTRSYGLGPKTIFKWMKVARENGLDALDPIPRTGRNRTLSKVNEEKISRWLLLKSPRDFGIDAQLWNRDIIRQLVAKELGVELSVSTIHRLLHRTNVAPQKDIAGKKNQDGPSIRTWMENDYPEIQKLAKKQNAQIFWLSENTEIPDCVMNEVEENSLVSSKNTRFMSVVSNRGYFIYDRLSRQNFDEDLMKFVSRFIQNYDGIVFLVTDSFISPSNDLGIALQRSFPKDLKLFEVQADVFEEGKVA